MDRFLNAGLPGAPPQGVPEALAGFEEVRLVCTTKDTAAFRQWVSWSLFHAAAELATDVVLHRREPVAELIELLQTDGHSQAAVALLWSVGKDHPSTRGWLRSEVASLAEMRGEALTTALDRVAHIAKRFDAVELAPQLTALAAGLDDSAPGYIKDRITRIARTLLR